MTVDGITRRDMLKQAGTIGAVGVVGGSSSISTATTRTISEEIRLPVALSPGDPKNEEIAATLTLPPEQTRKPVVQLLVHGITYGQYYYDFPYKPDQYSYVTHATEAGYPTLNIDRIGYSKSSHPAPEQLTLDANAFVLHQLIQALHAGEIRAVAGEDVMLVGHGYGALTAVKHQAQYGDADYLILTGYTQQYAHAQNLPAHLTPSETLPAYQDDTPRFNGLSPGYRTTTPGTRDIYYYTSNADSTVIAVDDRHKQTVTDAELTTATDVLDASLDVTVPVLEIVGDQDAVFCGMNPCTAPLGATTTEPILWPADFTMEVLPATGHAVFLHHTAPTAFSTIKTWMNNQLDNSSRG
jgi:pimeloyl-ACP methyl ester carboxylesterase